MSDPKFMDLAGKAEFDNVETQRRLGAEMRAKIPGRSPYETVREAARQLYPGMDPKRDDEVFNPNALAGWEQNGIGGTVHMNDAQALSGPYQKMLAPESRDDYLTGVYMHEILGHGGDGWRTGGKYNDSNPDDEPHFMNAPQNVPGQRADSINFLEPSIAKVQDPQEFSKQQALRDAQAKQEAMRRGLQTELPQNVKGQLPAPFFPTAPSPYSAIKPSY